MGLINTDETKKLRDRFNNYFDQKLRLEDKLDDIERYIKAFENDRQRLNLAELTRDRIREIKSIMLELDERINIKLGIWIE